jgi:DNA replication protein DnaC
MISATSSFADEDGRAPRRGGRPVSASLLPDLSGSVEHCPHCGGMGFIVPDLPLSDPNFGKAIPCRCQQQVHRRRRLTRLQQLGSLGSLHMMRFDTFIPEPTHLSLLQKQNLRRALETTMHFADHPEGWLVLSGGYGCGKTHLAASIANQLVARYESALFMLVPDLLDHLRAAYNPESELEHDTFFDQVRNVPVLLLDDLGAQRSTPWAQEKLFQLLNHRYNTQLPTVITTNQRLEDLDPRLRSRLADARLVSHFVILAPDFRSGQNALKSEIGTLNLHAAQTFQSFVVDREDLRGAERLNLKTVHQAVVGYATSPEGWLVLLGQHGCGKTHLAAAVAHEWQQRNLGEVIFVSVPDLLDYLRAAFDPEMPQSYDRRFDAIKKTPLLVLDDLGTESATAWAKEKLFQLLNYRYDAMLPTVITAFAESKQTGSSPDGVRLRAHAIEPWLYARLFDINRCQVCSIEVPGYRTSRSRLDAGRNDTNDHSARTRRARAS